MHAKYCCKKSCCDCDTSCPLDRELACSPDCDYLSPDGKDCYSPEGPCDFFLEVKGGDDDGTLS